MTNTSDSDKEGKRLSVEELGNIRREFEIGWYSSSPTKLLLDHISAMDAEMKRERENGHYLATYLNQLHPIWKCGSPNPAGCGLCVLLATYTALRAGERETA